MNYICYNLLKITLQSMNPFLSFYLNFLRVYAAIGVLVFHCTFYFFSERTLSSPYLSINLGHKMVIIFFVLSGYVIAFSAEKKSHNLQEYLSDRFIRLYSVIIPALIFTLLIDRTGMYFAPEAYAKHLNETGNYYVRYVIALLNLQQNWTLASKVSTNLPFWSIAYEFWYYVFLGFALFIKNRTVKIGAMAGLLLFTGPKIVLLLPVWLVGVGLYYVHKKLTFRPNQTVIWILFLLSFILLNLYVFNVLPTPFPQYFPNGKPPLFFSSDFINDYYLSMIVGANIFLSILIDITVLSNAFTRFIQYLANGTFTLYLFHYPLLVFCSVFIPYDKQNLLHVLLLLVAQFIALTCIGHALEKSRFAIKAALASRKQVE